MNVLAQAIAREEGTDMRIRSHLDPTLFVIFQHIDTRDYDAEFRALARSLRAARGTDLSPLINALAEREQRVFAHERYHFWQGLRLPFLHFYALRTLRTGLLGARELSAVEPDWRRWPDLAVTAPSFDRLDASFHLAGDPSGQLAFGKQTPAGYKLNITLTAKDMLECAASIFDFHGACQTRADLSDPLVFSRWRKRNPAYLQVYDFLRDFYGSERLALRTTLPMINAAFCTSVPERALAELTARVWGTFAKPGAEGQAMLLQPEPLRWPELFRDWLAKLPYDISFGESPSELDIFEPPFFYMDPENWLGLTVAGGFQHPFLGPLAHEWLKRAKEVPGLEHYLDMPGYIANHAAHKFALDAEPQLRVVRVFFEDGSDKAFAVGEGLVGPAFKDPVLSSLSASEYRGFILDTMAVYGAFRRAFAVHMAEAARTCHHIDCPHHADNFCNAYPLIPASFEQCGFPNRMTDWIVANRRDAHA